MITLYRWLVMLAVLSIALSDGAAPEHDVVKSRQKRIVFPLNAAIGVRRNTFGSVNQVYLKTKLMNCFYLY